MRDNNESIDKVVREIVASDPKGASNAISILLISVRRLNIIVDDLNKEIQELKRIKRLRNPITGEYGE